MATTPTVPQQAPDPQAPPTSPSSAPDLMSGISGLSQPGVQGTSEFQQAQGFEQKAQQANQRAADLANQPTNAPPPPHARLLGMVQGLATGLSAFGTALATRGAEGGAKEVAQIQGEQQAQKLQAQQQAMNQKNQAIQQQISVADTNHKMGQQIWLMANMPNEMAESDLKVKQGQQALQTGKLGQIGQAQDVRTKALQDLVQTGDVDSYNSTLQQVGGVTGTPPATGGAPAAPGTSTVPPAARASWQNSVDAAVKAYPNDPAITQAAAVLADPKADPKAMASAAIGAGNRMKALDAGTESQSKQAAAGTAVVKAEQEKASQAAYLKQVSKDAQGNPTQDFATWQAGATKAAEVAAQQGDPATMGAMAADGLLTIPQIALSRQLDKKAFQQLLEGADAEAKKNGMPEITVNGRPTGHYFNSNAATQQYQYVSEFNNPNSKTQSGITAGNTFINHAADLNDLAKQLQSTNTPLLNAPLNQLKGKFGDADIARLNAAVQPVITEYNNALAAGFAPQAEDADASRAILNGSSSAAQIAAAGQQMAHSLLRRLDSQDQAYYSHTGTHYPNMITPDAKDALGRLGLSTDLQSGGSFGGVPQVVNKGTTGTQPQVGAAHPVIVNGKQVGVTRDGGKTMTAN